MTHRHINHLHYKLHSAGSKPAVELKTSSSAVAKRPRDASCLSVVSFVASIVQYLKRSFLLYLVTSASDLLVHTIRLCSVVFSVTSSLAVIHAIYRDCV